MLIREEIRNMGKKRKYIHIKEAVPVKVFSLTQRVYLPVSRQRWECTVILIRSALATQTN